MDEQLRDAGDGERPLFPDHSPAASDRMSMGYVSSHSGRSSMGAFEDIPFAGRSSIGEATPIDLSLARGQSPEVQPSHCPCFVLTTFATEFRWHVPVAWREYGAGQLDTETVPFLIYGCTLPGSDES